MNFSAGPRTCAFLCIVCSCMCMFVCIAECVYGTRKCMYMYVRGGALGVMVNVIGNGLGDPSSNPGRVCLHFT